MKKRNSLEKNPPNCYIDSLSTDRGTFEVICYSKLYPNFEHKWSRHSTQKIVDGICQALNIDTAQAINRIKPYLIYRLRKKTIHQGRE